MDAAEAILFAAEHYNASDPVNIGAGFEVSIREVVDRITVLTGFKGAIIWDMSKPGGQPRRCLDTSKAEKLFGFRAMTSLSDGLRKTIDWSKATAFRPR